MGITLMGSLVIGLEKTGMLEEAIASWVGRFCQKIAFTVGRKGGTEKVLRILKLGECVHSIWGKGF